jgi:diketogulonate reductase-like aldo/keto reductase
MFLAATAATGAGLSLGITPAHADIRPKTVPVIPRPVLPGPAIPGPAISGPAILRAIPGTAERIPVIGVGTWITFNVGSSRRLRDGRAEVLRTFFDRGGTVVDSSPMYGSAEDVIGYCLDKIGKREFLFGTTKVWTPLITDGEDHMSESRALWRVEKFDLMQVHNLVNWAGNLETLSDDTAAGRVRHIGITTSHGSRHSQMARVMANPRVDAVQLTYNITDRSAEQRLLPLAAEPGLALVINRPFRRGGLFRRFARHPLPEWAAEIECTNWAQFFLKFVILHPAVTCATPATSQVSHMKENMGALYGALPDTAMRARIVRYTEGL